MEATRQHVLEEAAHELVATQAAGSSATGGAFLVLEGDRSFAEADDPGVGEGDTKDVAGEVVEHGLLTAAPRGHVEDPGRPPRSIGNGEIGALLAQQGAEFPADELGESLDG